MLQFLHEVLKQCKGSKQELQWTQTAKDDFRTVKKSLAEASSLVHPKPDAPTNIMSDASDTAVGAVLQQFIDGHWCPVAFFQKNFPQQKQSIVHLTELLVMYLAIKHFRHFVEGWEFHILTNHKPLTFALFTKPTKLTPRQCCHLNYISQFTSDIHNTKGSNKLILHFRIT